MKKLLKITSQKNLNLKYILSFGILLTFFSSTHAVENIQINTLEVSTGDLIRSSYFNNIVGDLKRLSVASWNNTGDSLYHMGGRVGIGTENPNHKLTISEGALGGSFGFTPNYTEWSSYGVGDGGAAIYNDGGIYQKLMIVGNNSAGGEREVGIWDNLTINGTTRLGGTTYIGGEGLLAFSSNIGGGERGIILQGNTGNGVLIRGGTTGTHLMIKNNGNIGIGTTSPAYNLHVNGDAGKPGGGSWSNASDIRLKDIQGDYKKGLTDISKLHAVMFNYRNGNIRKLPSDKNHVGFIAQEVQKIFPESVEVKDDGYLDFNMHSINVALVNAIQELNIQNKTLIGIICEEHPEKKICQK